MVIISGGIFWSFFYGGSAVTRSCCRGWCRQTNRGISSEDGPELASPTPNTRTLGIAGAGLVAFWRQNFCQMIFSIMGGVGHISHTYQSGCPSTGSLGCLDTSRVSSSNHQILAASNKPLLLSKEVNTEIIYFTPCWSLHCRQYCPPVPMIEVNHWDHAVLSSSDHKDSWYRGLSIRNSFF